MDKSTKQSNQTSLPSLATFLSLFTPTGQGNIDLLKRPKVHNADGSTSTVRSISFGADGKEVLVPTVVGDKVVSDDQAIKHYMDTGQYLGKFNSPKQADNYAQLLHDQQALLYTTQFGNSLRGIINLLRGL